MSGITLQKVFEAHIVELGFRCDRLISFQLFVVLESTLVQRFPCEAEGHISLILVPVEP